MGNVGFYSSFRKNFGDMSIGPPDRDVHPNNFKSEIFDPQLGNNSRRIREPPVSAEVLNGTHIPFQHRDYCVGYVLDTMRCLQENSPFYHRCWRQRGALEHCRNEDYIFRLKEYERERRLLERKREGKAPFNDETSDAEEIGD